MKIVVAVFEIILLLLFCLTLAHGIRRYNVKRLLLGFSLIAIVVTIEENCSMLLTHDYAYYGYHLWIGQFPVAIMLGWITVSYLGFIISARINNVVLGSFMVSCLDAGFEPAAYFFGLWTWHNTVVSPLYYFKAPIQNAIGWVLFTLLGTLILKKLLK